jgi:hypothetical protein
MSTTPKTRPKKLKLGSTIAVDEQIIRWREQLRREGRVLGRHMAKEKRLREKRREEVAKTEPHKRKWFE